MSGDCDVCIDGYDGQVEFFFSSTVKCRKPTKCQECGAAIERGHRYQRVGGKCEGEMWTSKVCLFCEEVGKVFSCGEGRSYGNLWEEMHDYAFPNLTTASPCFRLFSASAKAELLKRWQGWKGLREAQR